MFRAASAFLQRNYCESKHVQKRELVWPLDSFYVLHGFQVSDLKCIFDLLEWKHYRNCFATCCCEISNALPRTSATLECGQNADQHVENRECGYQHVQREEGHPRKPSFFAQVAHTAGDIVAKRTSKNRSEARQQLYSGSLFLRICHWSPDRDP